MQVFAKNEARKAQTHPQAEGAGETSDPGGSVNGRGKSRFNLP